MPWKNGGGTTREIAKDSESDPPAWRLSVATIDRSGPFSDFTGYDRTMVPLFGVPFELHFQESAPVRVHDLYQLVNFPGEWRTECRLLTGTAEDLNVMTLRESFIHRVRTLKIVDCDVPLERDGMHFVYVLEGAAAGDTFRIQDEERAHVDGSRVCIVTIARP